MENPYFGQTLLPSDGSEDAVAKQRMDAGESFGCIESVCPRGDAVRGESGLRSAGDGFVCQRMRQRLEQGIVFEREVRAFVGFDEDEDARGLAGVGAQRVGRSAVPCFDLIVD